MFGVPVNDLDLVINFQKKMQNLPDSAYFITPKGKRVDVAVLEKYISQGVTWLGTYLEGDNLDTCKRFIDMVDALIIIDQDNVEVFPDFLTELIDYAMQQGKQVRQYGE